MTAVSRPLTICMPHTRGEGDGKNCVSILRVHAYFVVADFCFPSRSCPYPVSVSLTRPAECTDGVDSPEVPHPSIPTPSFRSFRIPSCSFPSLPQFAVASPVKVASKIHSRYSFVAPQYTYHMHVHAVHIMQAHFWARHIRKVPTLVACTPLKMM